MAYRGNQAMTLEENARALLDLLEHAANDFNGSDAALVFRSRDGKRKAVMLADSDRAEQLIEIQQHEWELAGIIVAATQTSSDRAASAHSEAVGGKVLAGFRTCGNDGKDYPSGPGKCLKAGK
jgi:hypothetical protein